MQSNNRAAGRYLTADNYAKRHRLSLETLYAIAFHRPQYLPNLLWIAGRMRVADRQPDALAADKSTWLPLAPDFNVLPTDLASEFIVRAALEASDLLRLCIRRDLPKPYRDRQGNIVVTRSDVSYWELGQMAAVRVGKR